MAKVLITIEDRDPTPENPSNVNVAMAFDPPLENGKGDGQVTAAQYYALLLTAKDRGNQQAPA